MHDFWPFFVNFWCIFWIFVVLDATRIVPHICIANVNCFQSQLHVYIIYGYIYSMA